MDRSGTEFFLSDRRLLGSHTELDSTRQRNSDGHREALAVVRPCYVLDTRWSAGVLAPDDTHRNSIYTAGVLDRRYCHKTRSTGVFGAWSTGLVNGWVQRYALGLNRKDDRYASEPDPGAPDRLPGDKKVVGPFLRYELLEDRHGKLSNRNLIERSEFFALGLASTMQLDRSEPGRS